MKGGLDNPIRPGSATPQAAGVADAGTSRKYAREDHVHPAQSVPSVPNASNANPQALGSVAPGVSADYSRADHVHPSVSVPQPASVAPLAPGTAAVGTSALYARQDHVHPSQTVPVASNAAPLALGVAASGVSADFSRADHVHPSQTITVPVGAPVTRTLSFATAYQASTNTKAAMVSVLVDMALATLVVGANANTVVMYVGPTAASVTTPFTGGVALDQARYDLTISVLSISAMTIRQKLTALIPAGYYFSLVRTAGAGYSITSAFDQVVG